MRQAYTHGQRDVTDPDVLEIKAFFAVLYLAGVKMGDELNNKQQTSKSCGVTTALVRSSFLQ